MEYTPVPEPGGGWQGCGMVDLMKLALSMNKSALLLWPVYNNNRHEPAWQNVADSIQHFRDVGAPIDDDRVVVVLAMYGKGGRGVQWWNKTANSVEHVYTWLQAHRTKTDDGAAPGAVPGREASGLTVATLVREEHRCTDALHGTLGRLPERMTVRVFGANQTDSVRVTAANPGRWYRGSSPFGRPFALDDTEGALVGISVDNIGTTFAVTGSVVETAPYYGHSDCTAVVEASVETFNEFKEFNYQPHRNAPPEKYKRMRTGSLLSGVVQMACRYTADDGVAPLF